MGALLNGHGESITAGAFFSILSSALLWYGLMPWQATVATWGICLLLIMPNRTKQAGDTILGWYRTFRGKDPITPDKPDTDA